MLNIGDGNSRASGRSVRIAAASAMLHAVLDVPSGARGVIIVANGAADPIYMRGNQSVAAALRDAGMATLVLDLLTHGERAEDAESSVYRFDLRLLADRLVSAATWCTLHPSLRGLPVGVFASGTTASAALLAAAKRPELFTAMVSRAGRPELAGATLASVGVPVLLLVGANDSANLAVSLAALDLLPATTQLHVVANGRHLLDDPDDLAVVAQLSVAWFARQSIRHPVLRPELRAALAAR